MEEDNGLGRFDAEDVKTDHGDRKKALNISMDPEIYKKYKRYPGNMAKIISSLSTAFFAEVEDHPELFQHVIDGDITVRYKEKKKSE